MDLDRDLRALITAHLNAGNVDIDLLSQVQSAIEQVRTVLQTRSDAAAMRTKMAYHLYVDDRGQRWRVAVTDLADFCRERRLNVEKMLELSQGGRDGLPEYRGYRRGPGQNVLLYGSPYTQTPEHEPFEDEKPTAERRMFKPKPQPVQYNHRPTATWRPKFSLVFPEELTNDN